MATAQPRVMARGGAGDAPVAYYTALLARRPVLAEALCWTVIEPFAAQLSIGEVARRLGGSPDSISLLPWDAAYQQDYNSAPVIHLGHAGHAVVMIEANGSQGVTQAQWLSQDARLQVPTGTSTHSAR